jgi:hypothetical protein
MLYIKADGTEREVDGRLTLEGLQFLVGGHAQHVVLPDGRHLFCDEDGKQKQRPLNKKATELFYPRWDHVVGDVLVLTPEEFADMSNVKPFPGPRA